MTEERVFVGGLICAVVLIIATIIEFWPKNKDNQ